MKAKHRHELKTNELAEWLSNLPQWARKNRGTIIYISIVVIVVLGVYIWRGYEKNVVSVQKQHELTNLITQILEGKSQIIASQAQGADTSYMLIQVAERLKDIAQNEKDKQVAALALIKRAEALRMELHYRLGTVSKEDVESAIRQAKQSYNEAIAMSEDNPSLVAKARLGMGLCDEELGNFKKAREIYNEIVISPHFKGTVAVVTAKQRLETMGDYQQEIAFRKAPKTGPTGPLQPRIQFDVSGDSQELIDVLGEPETNSPGQQ